LRPVAAIKFRTLSTILIGCAVIPVKPRSFSVARVFVCLMAGLMMITSAHSLDLQGHRGARGLAPENTLPAFARALSIGVSTLELDCAITKDGVIVVSHDALLNPDFTRGPDGRWLAHDGPSIASLSFDELQRYDVGRIRPGSPYATRFSHQQQLDGVRIPRLAELFALVRKSANSSVRFNIETKTSPVDPGRTLPPEEFTKLLLSTIKTENMQGRVTLQSFDWRTLQFAQSVVPGIPTAYLSAQQPWMDNIQANAKSSPWTAGLHVSAYNHSVPRMVKAAGGAIWSPYFGEITPENLKEAQDLGLKVVVWTVNTEPDMLRMIAIGVDGIISDYPDVLRRVAAEQGIRLPPATSGEP
jgi:glycerophosphoryl diester phosphodiesterase